VKRRLAEALDSVGANKETLLSSISHQSPTQDSTCMTDINPNIVSTHTDPELTVDALS